MADTMECNVSFRLSEDNAHAVLSQFDRSIVDSLASVNAKAGIKAELKTYKFFDNVWQFDLNNVVCRVRLFYFS